MTGFQQTKKNYQKFYQIRFIGVIFIYTIITITAVTLHLNFFQMNMKLKKFINIYLTDYDSGCGLIGTSLTRLGIKLVGIVGIISGKQENEKTSENGKNKKGDSNKKYSFFFK